MIEVFFLKNKFIYNFYKPTKVLQLTGTNIMGPELEIVTVE